MQRRITGDEASLSKLLYGDTETDEELNDGQNKSVEEYQKAMYTDRNAGIAKKAESCIEGGKSVFFAVATAHFLGDDGIVKLLTDKGYNTIF